MSEMLTLTEGQRFRTAGTTFEVAQNAEIAAALVEVTPQATKLLKVACSRCGYTVRVTQRWLTKAGAPICPTKGHGPMERAEARTPKSKRTVAIDIKTPVMEPVMVPMPEPIIPASKLAQLLETV